MKIFILILIFLASTLFAEGVVEEVVLSDKELLEAQKESDRVSKLESYAQQLKEIEDDISKDQVWMKSYASYLTSLEVRDGLKKIKKRINYLKKRARSTSEKDELSALISKEKILTSQVEKLKEHDTAPFSTLLTPPNIEEIPTISNPIDMFNGISLIKSLNSDFENYIKNKEELIELIILLSQESEIYIDLKSFDVENLYTNDAKAKEKQLEKLTNALDTMIVTADLYQKRLEIVEINIDKEVEKQIFKLINIGIVILVAFMIFFLMKQVVKKYITDNERFYMANKIITFVNVTLVILIVFFSYLENVSYLVTILGFASAGIAIAMKDWFMSILGWLVIVFGGSIHVGDRIRVDMDGIMYVGDVMDISLLRMTLLEDITLTTVSKNRRAGRILFIPNNYVFTRMIANYSHSSLKTVWDGIDIVISFESNHRKAMHICKEITKKYSKGYTDITRKQLNKLRNNYSLKNTNVEPRIFSFIESNGVVISSWYLTNAYATLTLRSVISVDIVEAFNKEDDITIAYPTQKLHIERSVKVPPFDTKEVV